MNIDWNLPYPLFSAGISHTDRNTDAAYAVVTTPAANAIICRPLNIEANLDFVIGVYPLGKVGMQQAKTVALNMVYTGEGVNSLFDGMALLLTHNPAYAVSVRSVSGFPQETALTHWQVLAGEVKVADLLLESQANAFVALYLKR
jgi:hypothetical protein